jgi:hypothetical protein
VGLPSIGAVQPVHVATWIEAGTRELASPSVKLRRARPCGRGVIFSRRHPMVPYREARCVGLDPMFAEAQGRAPLPGRHRWSYAPSDLSRRFIDALEERVDLASSESRAC